MYNNLLFLDTETTAVEDGRIIQLATLTNDTKGCLTFKPPVPITIEAMAVHHITNEMVANRPPFDPDRFVQYEYKDKIIVAHNAKFDIEVLKREGVKIDDSKIIDTLRVAQHLIDAPSYSLQYLRYFLNLQFNDNEEITPHDAWGDVVVLKALFKKLYSELEIKIQSQLATVDNDKGCDLTVTEEAVIEQMIKLTNTPVLLKTINFGKHKGKTFAEIWKCDSSYLLWLADQKNLSEDLTFTLVKFLEDAGKGKFN